MMILVYNTRFSVVRSPLKLLEHIILGQKGSKIQNGRQNLSKVKISHIFLSMTPRKIILMSITMFSMVRNPLNMFKLCFKGYPLHITHVHDMATKISQIPKISRIFCYIYNMIVILVLFVCSMISI